MEKILKAIKKLDSKFDSKIDNLEKKIDKRFDQVNVRFNQQDDLVSTIAIQVSSHEDRLDKLTNLALENKTLIIANYNRMATKDDIRGIHKTLDWLVVKFTKFEQELTVLAHRSTIHTDQIVALQGVQ